MKLSAWGRLSHEDYPVSYLSRSDGAGNRNNSGKSAIVFGMGRSYGDACLNPGGMTYLSSRLDRFIDFDAEHGILTCEAGVALGQIQSRFAPRGWMLPVTPGTQYVTVGGAIANDVHGKNHHRTGCFGNHVNEILLERTDGSRLTCTPSENRDWFAATIGGLGLTGIIRQATLKLRQVSSCWLDTETLPYSSLDEFFTLSGASEADWEYAVSWIDCSKAGKPRGIFIRANHRENDDEPAAARRNWRVPLTPPVTPVNRLSVTAFNKLYYAAQRRRTGLARDHYSRYFYPLDSISDWNRLYGRKGFYQYQLVVPMDNGQAVIQSLLQEISRSGMGSFLSVLKTFGDYPSPGMLSFPRHGVTLALDFPNRGANLERLFARLDAIVLEAGGRLYPAKDARMPAEFFAAGYPQLQNFLPFRDPGLSSGLSRRLMGS